MELHKEVEELVAVVVSREGVGSGGGESARGRGAEENYSYYQSNQ